MKRNFLGWMTRSSLILSLLTPQLATTITAQTSNSNVENDQETGQEASESKEAASLNTQAEFQLDLAYPISSDGDYFDDSLVTNQMQTFKAYEGQGYVWVQADDAADFQLFINQQEVDLRQEDLSDWCQVDISQYTVNGTNTIQINRVDASEGELAIKVPYPVLVDKTAEWADNDSFKLIDQIIEAEIDQGFSSAQLVVTYNGQVIKQSSYGYINRYSSEDELLDRSIQVTDDTLYDLASNTKMYATNYALQKLVTDGELDVDQKVSEILTDFKDDPRDAIKGKTDMTVRDLLEHQAGFPADPQYHNNNYDKNAEDFRGNNTNELYTQDRGEILQKIIDTPLDYKPGLDTVYSDVDYMLLGLIIEVLTDQSLDAYLQETFYEPLQLSHTSFNPLDNGFQKEQTAATELHGNTRDGVIDFNNIRTERIHGEVHDEKAYYTMGGVSGHAGLFSNASDLAVLTQLMINGGGYGEQTFFSPEVIDQFTKAKDTNSSYGLGWRRQGDDAYAWAFSPLVSRSTVGHTGWTGTLSVIDMENEFALVLLTNAKNSPVIDNEANPNDFSGDHFLTSRYGLIATLATEAVYTEGMNPQLLQQANDGKLIDMFIQQYQMLQADPSQLTDYDVAVLNALDKVLTNRSGTSPLIRNFIEPTIYQEIDTYLNN
ncbi:penicillin binding protein PBP4B [Aerococcaceae bacterium WGS1372]